MTLSVTPRIVLSRLMPAFRCVEVWSNDGVMQEMMPRWYPHRLAGPGSGLLLPVHKGAMAKETLNPPKAPGRAGQPDEFEAV